MKNVLKAVSYVDGKHSTIVYSAFFFPAPSSSCLHFIKVSVGWLGEIRYHHKGGGGIEIRLKKETGQRAMEPSGGSAGELQRASKAKTSGGLQPRAWPCLFKLQRVRGESCRSDEAGLGPDELSGRSQGIHGRRQHVARKGRKQRGRRGRRKEGVAGRQAEKTQTLCF